MRLEELELVEKIRPMEEARDGYVSMREPQGVVVRHRWQKHLLTFLMVFGPGLIVMEADIDAGALSTYGRTRSICSCAGI